MSPRVPKVLAVLLALLFAATAAAAVDEARILADAKDVLRGNWVPAMNSTLPSAHLYPHQWSWDAAFVAMGYSHYDTARAITEMDSLFKAQWQHGLLPHIVFNKDTDQTYFPGPAFWNIETFSLGPAQGEASSGIVQPPVHAIAAWAVWNNAHNAENAATAKIWLATIYPKLALWHKYLYTERDPKHEGLVFIRHMWESGMDNSPVWDAALEAISLDGVTLPEYKRVDKGKVGDNERPSSFFYDRAVYLIQIFYQNKYDEAVIFEKSPFVVQDVLFNSILVRAGESLADIADLLGMHDKARVHRADSARTAEAMTAKLYDPETGFFLNYDMVADRRIPSRISGGLAALYGAKVSEVHVDAAVSALLSDEFLNEDLSAWTIPSVSRRDPGFTNSTYWRGPAWLNINYFVRDGLMRNAHLNPDASRVAAYLRRRSLELVQTVGFFEYFSPLSGTAHGGHRFSWSAALCIDWIANPDGARSRTWISGYSVSSLRGLLALYPIAAKTLAALLVALALSAVFMSTSQRSSASATSKGATPEVVDSDIAKATQITSVKPLSSEHNPHSRHRTTTMSS